MREHLARSLAENWTIWLVSSTLVVAAAIDAIRLKVPNWLTFPMIAGGWLYSGLACGWEGLGWSVLGTLAGLGLLLPLYAVGGMGAGDVKLLAGVGAWVWPAVTFGAFCVSAVLGGVLAVVMALASGKWSHHRQQFLTIATEMLVLRDPQQLSAIAAARKPSMLLLPYGVPIAIGTIGYFAWMGMLV
jgi:prepilin peptidase CpaA